MREELGPLQALPSMDLDPTQKEDKSYHEKAINSTYRNIENKLTTFLQHPPYHTKHEDQIRFFNQHHSFEKSVFIMTKYPDEEKEIEKNGELKRVIEVVKDAIEKHGYCPRLASDEKYHPQVWDNIELYLLGCSKGVAILEDCYMPELNPNVAMEWGWMRGMGKDVLCLVEKNFRHKRADWEGLIEDYFDWKNPEDGIVSSIQQWLVKI